MCQTFKNKYEAIIKCSIKHIFFFFHLDIDECLEEVDDCEHNCHNHEGGYSCSCLPGHKLDEDGFSCEGNSHF